MVLSLLAAAWVLGLSAATFKVPFTGAAGDTLLGLSEIKGMLENGWFLVNPALGAPMGLDFTDFSGLNGDSANWVILRGLGWLITDPVVLLNTFFLLGFALAGGVAYLVLRDLGARRMTALPLAVFYANLSFHFTRGEGHLMLGMYYVAPAAIWLLLRVLTGRPLVRRGHGTGLRSWLTSTNIATALAIAAIGGSTIYYAFFTLVLLIIATAVRGLAGRKWRMAIPGAAVFGATAFVLLLNLAPGIAYRVSNGANLELAQRTPNESWLYSFDLTRLVFMVAGHRVERISNLGNKVAGNSLTVGEGDILGLVLGMTFLTMLVMLAVWIIRGRGASGADGAVLNAAVMLAMTCFLLGATGGLGAMFATIVSPQIRAWTRITPFLAFLCLLVLAAGIDWLRRQVDGASPWRVAASTAIPILIAAFALWDGTSPSNRPDHESNRAAWQADQAFVNSIESTLPAESMVLQLPLRPFPEAGSMGQMGDYEHLRAYIHSSGLRWSYPTMKGRPSDWTATAAGLTTAELLPAAAATGFSGIWLDRRAYEDSGAAIEQEIRDATGTARPALVSADGSRAFYDLARLRGQVDKSLSPDERAKLSEAMIPPVAALYGRGFYSPESDDDNTWRWATNDAVLTIANTSDTNQRARWTASLKSAIGSTTRIFVAGRAVRQVTFTKPDQDTPVDLVLSVPPSGVDVRFETVGNNLGPNMGDSRALFLQVMNPRLINDAFKLAEAKLRLRDSR